MPRAPPAMNSGYLHRGLASGAVWAYGRAAPWSHPRSLLAELAAAATQRVEDRLDFSGSPRAKL